MAPQRRRKAKPGRRGADKRTRWLLVVLIVGAFVLVHHFGRASALGWWAGTGATDPDTADDGLSIVSWNLKNFPADHDLTRMSAIIAAVAPHVLVLEEVKDPAALKTVFPGRTMLVSEHGGRGHQHLAILLDERVEVVGPLREHHDLELGGRVRPAISAYLRVRDGGPDFHLVAVHLKATPAGYGVRTVQWGLLSRLLSELPTTEPGFGDKDMVVVGDFNVTGTRHIAPQQEQAALQRVLAAAALRPVPNPLGCSAYWDGSRRDAWLEPSLLDFVFVGGFADVGRLHSSILGACAKHRCQPIRSTRAHPELDVTAMSDHCPLLLELERN